MSSTEKIAHEFALYYSLTSAVLSNLPLKKFVSIDEKELYHRIVKVLRLKSGESIILFDQSIHALLMIEIIEKQRIICSLIEKSHNTSLHPKIITLLPLLKKSNFEDALYRVVECGTTEIRIVITHNSERNQLASKDYVRLQKIIIAAAEQSKHYMVPSLHKALPLQSACENLPLQTLCLLADPTGAPCTQLLCTPEKSHKTLALLIGPEAGLTPEEKEYVISYGFQPHALTPTILRAKQAAGLFVGMCRSLL